MSKEIYISTTPHETRLAIVESDALTEIYYERENEYTLAGSIYNGRVTRVLPGMQSSFVDIGLERDAFLYITDFMEEAGDTADFESGSAGGGRGRERAPRRDAEPTEGVEAKEAAPRVEGERSGGERSGRNDRSGRRDRNGRRDGRGGRDDRGGNREARPAAHAAVDAPVAPTYDSGWSDEEEVAAAPAAAAQTEFAPEGAPGADGSRRWRGRRGRRRGRGTAEMPVQGGDEPVSGEPGEEQAAEFAAPVQAMEEAPREARGESRNVGRSQDGRRDGRGGDRGSRGGRPERGGRDDRQESVRERFAPRAARFGGEEGGGRDSGGEVNLQAEAEPFLLPGESLSKYRKNADGTPEQPAAPAAGVTVILPTPSSEFKMASGWDGGAVLPGETLSRRGGGGRNEGRGEGRGDSRQAGQRGGGRDQAPFRNERSGSERSGNEQSARPAREALHPSEAVQPAVTSQHEPEAFELSQSGHSQTGVMSFEPTGTVEPAVEAPELKAEPGEYEPAEDAAVSYRVDPVPPSEFRQSVPATEVVAEPVAEPAAAQTEPAFVAAEEDAYVEDHAAPVAEANGVEFTSIQDTGEMISEPFEAETHVAAQTDGHGDSPVEHEDAVQSVTLHEAETGTQAAPAATAAPQQFAPGDGELEEEMLDEEDADPLSIQAHSAYDDTEEETLEGAADLGTMIREMSIDQITRPAEPADDEDEDDDFEIDEEEFDEDELEGGDEAAEDESDETGETFADQDEFNDIEQREEAEGAEAAERSARPVVEGEGGGGDRRSRRDGGRRGGRDRDRGSRDRRSSGAGSSGGGRSSHSGGGGGERRPSRHSAQTTNLPAISDLLKPGQELLVQIAKEPIAKKGARITSHIALPGRFLVFMPTVSHIGVSRKIESDAERRRLKEILLSEKGDASGGFIVRTAAANASEDELRSDLRFLLNLWADIKTRSESSKSPALIYHDLNLVERILRDQVTDNFSAIWVDTEDAYERVLRFLQRFQPSLIRRVKLYTKDTPLFEQFGITEEINKALRSKVWLKSGGSIVINQTEALVAIDINTGKFVGKTARLEDTIVKTNLDAIPEIVRQIRLRDLGGIIIIDFIDMDERKNRNKVMAALEEELKSDRAPSKVLQFNDFGLVAITRKRVKQSLERTLSTTCGVCAGTGMVKSPVTVCNDIYIEMRKMQKHLDRGDVMLRVNPEVVKQLKSPGAKWLQEMEEMVGRTILVKSDPSLHPEQFDLH